MKIKDRVAEIAMYAFPLAVAAVIKLFLSPVELTPFNADEAIVALMARHINQGQVPIFFYGQSYLGSLDPILVALCFRIFGEGVWVIRLVQSVLYLGTIATTMMLAHRIMESRRAAIFTGFLLAIPPVNVSLYSTVSLGGYGEMLLLGNFLLLGGLSLVAQISAAHPKQDWKFSLGLFLWGIGAGFAFWVFGLTLVYSIPIIILIFWRIFMKAPAGVIVPGMILFWGGLLGSSPWWLPAILSGDSRIIIELAGGAIINAESGPWLIRPLERFINLFVFGGTAMLGLRPPWDIRWLMLPMLPFILIFWLAVLIYSLKLVRDNKKNPGLVAILLMGVILGAGFIFSPYGNDPSGRYFLPMIIPMSIFGAKLLSSQFSEKSILQYIALGMILVFNLGGTIQAARPNPPGISTQFDQIAQVDQRYLGKLIEFLRNNKIDRGYTNYWVSYPLAFQSGEELIFVPRLPYHEDFRYTARDDRYDPYGEMVESSGQPAYITTKHPVLNDYLRDKFRDRQISWEEKTIGDFQIFYNLSQPVHVNEIDLGITTSP